MQLLVRELLELVHDAVDAVRVDEAARQTQPLVEDEVDSDVVEDVLLQLRVQLLLQPLLLLLNRLTALHH